VAGRVAATLVADLVRLRHRQQQPAEVSRSLRECGELACRECCAARGWTGRLTTRCAVAALAASCLEVCAEPAPLPGTGVLRP